MNGNCNMLRILIIISLLVCSCERKSIKKHINVVRTSDSFSDVDLSKVFSVTFDTFDLNTYDFTKLNHCVNVQEVTLRNYIEIDRKELFKIKKTFPSIQTINVKDCLFSESMLQLVESVFSKISILKPDDSSKDEKQEKPEEYYRLAFQNVFLSPLYSKNEKAIVAYCSKQIVPKQKDNLIKFIHKNGYTEFKYNMLIINGEGALVEYRCYKNVKSETELIVLMKDGLIEKFISKEEVPNYLNSRD